MVELRDDELRSGARGLVSDAPEPPDWSTIETARTLRRRRHAIALVGAAMVVALLAVGLVARSFDDDPTVVAGPDAPSSGAECGTTWIAIHTLFDSTHGTGDVPQFATVTPEQAAFLVKSGDVPDRVARALGGAPAELAARVIARPNIELGTVEVTARADSAAEARRLSDAFAEGLLASVQDIQQREIDRNRDVLEAAVQQLELELVGVVGTDPGSNATRERIQSDIIQMKIRLQELDLKAGEGSNIYSLGSSEAFQVTEEQLAELFDGAPC
jgi:hypothetical protein